MTTIDMISQVLSAYASNEIDEGEALRRVHHITCASARSPELLCILIHNAQTEIENHRAVIRSHVERIALDAKELLAGLEARGPDGISTTWIAMHMKGLLEAQASLKTERERLREFEQLLEG